MARKKGFMNEEVLAAAIAWAKSSGADKLVLHHFGEPLMHPQIGRFIGLIGEAGLAVQFSSNGLLLRKLWESLQKTETEITVMLAFHQWVDQSVDDYMKALSEFQARSVGTKIKVIAAYALKEAKFAIHDWGNGVKDNWDFSQCPFLRCNLAVILWNGDIATCCVDHEGVTATRNILTPGFDEHVSEGWSACESCDVGRLMKDEQW
jgi:hypothetical protein